MDRIKLEKISIIVLISAFVFMAGAAALSFANLNQVVENINRASNPNLNLLQLESLTSNLSYAESGVKSYNLTRDTQYIEPYIESLGKISALMDSINVNAYEDKRSIPLADSLTELVNEKMVILGEILGLRNNELVTEELNRINSKLSIADEANKKVPKGGLFKSKDERQKIKEAKEAAKPENVLKRLTHEIGNEVVGVKSDQLTELKDIKYQEFQLLKQDNSITKQIRSLIFKLQEIEKQQIVKNTLEASRLTAKTYRIIAIFCLLGTFLILATIIVIYYFIKKSKSYTTALKAANIEIESFAKAKESFLYNVSHELRTPLNALIGFSEQLNEERDAQKKSEITQIIYRSAIHLKEILNDILDFSKLSSDKFELRSSPFQLPHLLTDIQLILENHTAQKKLDANFDLKGDIPEYIVGDKLRLRQILLNIVDNAVKYTPQGSVSVEVSFEPKDEEKGILHARISDTGIGMSEKDLTKIFNAFEQASTRSLLTVNGTGLGLSITRQLIDLHQGTIQVDSEEGKGTTFSFSIPYATISKSEYEEQAKNIHVVDFHSIQGAKILVVDDVPLNLQLVEYILSKYDVQATLLEKGNEVLDTLEKQSFDLVLLDLNLQGISGFDICKQIRNHTSEDIRNLPVVAVSATHQSPESIINDGFNNVLSKPFTEAQLLKIVHQYFDWDENFELEHSSDEIFDRSHPAHLPIIEQAEKDLKVCVAQLKDFSQQENVDGILQTIHRLIPILHILGKQELKDESIVLEAFLEKNKVIGKNQKRLKNWMDKLEGFS